MIKKEGDIRYQNTENLIKTTLISLMQDKDISEITVLEIIKKAKISRATFYNHYKNTKEIFDAIENSLYTEISNQLKFFNLEDINKDLFKRLLNILSQNQDFFLLILKKPRSSSLMINIINLVKEKYSKTFLNIKPDLKPKILNNIFNYTIYGTIAILVEYVNNNCADSIDEIIDTIELLNKSVLLNVLGTI